MRAYATQKSPISDYALPEDRNDYCLQTINISDVFAEERDMISAIIEQIDKMCNLCLGQINVTENRIHLNANTNLVHIVLIGSARRHDRSFTARKTKCAQPTSSYLQRKLP